MKRQALHFAADGRNNVAKAAPSAPATATPSACNSRTTTRSSASPRSATQDGIKKAYRKLARKYHPDVSKEKHAARRMAEVNEANTVLGDAEKRAAYDTVGAQA